jgi:inosine triphosphate pyrophosphatase
MKGLPGPYVKWFWKNIGCEGLVRMLDGFKDKTAVAVSIIAYMGP